MTCSSVKFTLEEVMTTTAYLDLFLRTVSEPALLQTFLSFILLHRHESVHILDTLVSRINTPFQVGSEPAGLPTAPVCVFSHATTHRATHVLIIPENNPKGHFGPILKLQM